MAVVEELLRSESNGNISFGNYELAQKAKLEDFEHRGDIYKVKTYRDITKLEKNGLFLYESVPGTSVYDFCESGQGISFIVKGNKDVQITVAGESAGVMKTNLSGKLNISVELEENGEAEVQLIKK